MPPPRPVLPPDAPVAPSEGVAGILHSHETVSGAEVRRRRRQRTLVRTLVFLTLFGGLTALLVRRLLLHL
ncbi:MAG: hypothetical protein SFU57_05010 [Gemmatimonadales bacterium]|nr:hypothetical protein [Gemmatimonadales bacterium]